MKIPIIFDKDKNVTNLLQLPEEVYMSVYTSSRASEAFIRGRMFYVVLASSEEGNAGVCEFTIFILSMKQMVDEEIFSCELVEDDGLKIKAKNIIETEIFKTFEFNEKVRDDDNVFLFCQKIEKTLKEWHDNNFEDETELRRKKRQEENLEADNNKSDAK